MRRGDSIVIAGNDPTRQLRGNATAFGNGQRYGNEIATLRSQ